MIITKKFTMDLTQPGRIEAIEAVQDDRYSRNLEISLYSGGEPWPIPPDACALIRYCKSDGTGGLYDTLPDGTTAWSVSDNALTVALAPQVLTAPGSVFLTVTLNRGIQQISTFALLIHVHPAVNAEIGESESYLSVHNFLPAPADGSVGQFLRISAVDEFGHISALESAEGTGGMDTYVETGGVGAQQNSAAADDPLWSRWDARLAFGMDTAAAPVPFHVGGQLLADGTIIARNCGTQDKNRWGFHVLEAYAKDNFSRMTVLLDKHAIEAGSKPSLELYYYTGADHTAASYGNTKIGSDVAFHSFCFDRDRLTAYGSIDACMPITLARISLANDLDTTYKNVAAADAAYEPENSPEQNNRCLKFIALRKAENGAMFYDEDRHQVACKINGQWCSLPFAVIEDGAYDILDASQDTDVEWASGVIDGNGGIVANSARLYTPACLPAAATLITAQEGYEFCLVPYSEGDLPNAPSPYYDPDTGEFQGAAVYVKRLDLTAVSLSGYPNYRLIARRTDLANIGIAEGAHILISTETPDTEPEEESIWANGIIDGNGNIAENSVRLYTPDYISAAATSVTAQEGYEFCVVPYNAEGITNAPNPYYDPSTGSFSTTGALWYTSVDLSAISLGTGWVETESEFTLFKLIARRTDLADIAPSEGVNIAIA